MTHPAPVAAPFAAPALLTMQQVHEHVIARELTDYDSPVRRCAKLYGHDLERIPADLVAFEARWPRDALGTGFRTQVAYQRWRGKVIAAIKNATGELAAAKARRSRVDGWAELVERLEPYTEGSRMDAAIQPQRLIPLKAVADDARRLDLQPWQVECEAALRMVDDCGVARRRTLEKGLAFMDWLRFLPELADLLPADPIGEVRRVRRRPNGDIPEALELEISAWIDRATHHDWDEITEAFATTPSEGALGVHHAALRKWLSTIERLGLRDLRQVNGLTPLLEPDLAVLVLRDWTRSAEAGISPRTAATYTIAIATVAERNGVDAAHLRLHCRRNPALKAGLKASDEMSPKTRAFCEHLIETPSAKRTFLRLNQDLARGARKILEQATAEGRELRDDERVDARALGTLACIAAIETYGAPFRIANVLRLRHLGESPELMMPTAKTPHAKIVMPPAWVKNKATLPTILITRNGARALQTLEWYLKVIRPLYPQHEDSEHLFPAIESPGEPLPAATAASWLSEHVRISGRRMAPHNFRHAVASILVNRDPEQIALVAQCLGDTVGTAAKYYAWISPRLQIAAAQAAILDEAGARR
ncbi:hypothetical protein P2H44_11625 [Albimonas sp. CAU 1670]|uniref:hypothetical protein n=1 Tax=Albimonas sp. CAU 1670 TaxID=3032599 RepID=UPI0023D9D03F|nr:hypothetical protein [Albimonas sp. CAU 1670]MDF2233202.1 hypothetical protein [Albimonas sp. CAU 1670]